MQNLRLQVNIKFSYLSKLQKMNWKVLSQYNISITVCSIVMNLKIHQQTANPVNLAPEGPINSTRLARASPSISGGGCDSLSLRTSLHVMRVGWQTFNGGIMIRMPECRQPRIAPPRASTMKLTRKLQNQISKL
jgi:hypothetical protein